MRVWICRIATRVMFLAVLATSVIGCGHGPKVEHGTIEVYYVDGATKAEADKLGVFLLKDWGASPDRRSVQLKKTNDGYQFRMVVKKEFHNDEKMLGRMAFDAARISRDVFDGAAVELHACDENLKTIKTIPPREDVRYGVVEGNAEVYYASKEDGKDAQRLVQYLAELTKGAPARVSFKLARRDAVVEVHMVTNAGALNDPATLAGLGHDRERIAKQVFSGSAVELHLCDTDFKMIQVLK